MPNAPALLSDASPHLLSVPLRTTVTGSPRSGCSRAVGPDPAESVPPQLLLDMTHPVISNFEPHDLISACTRS
jgi:hypothetical protein